MTNREENLQEAVAAGVAETRTIQYARSLFSGSLHIAANLIFGRTVDVKRRLYICSNCHRESVGKKKISIVTLIGTVAIGVLSGYGVKAWWFGLLAATGILMSQVLFARRKCSFCGSDNIVNKRINP